ncbi:ras association domain-containing protein 1-like isoform X1 [Lampetra fluviatilis]
MNIEHHQELTLLYPAMRVKGAFSPFRRKKVLHRHVRTIFDSTGSDPRLREEKGEGHEFRPYTNPQFCDLCGEFIWGVYKQSLRCRICKFTCHHRCRELIRLDCQRQRSQLGSTSEQELDEDGKVEQVQSQVLSREEIEQKIKLYNVRSSSKTSMVQQENGTFTGFIKVQLNLQRPVSVADDGRAHNALLQPVAAPGPAGGGGGSGTCESTARRTTFYLPRGTEKQVHLSSTNTAREVIEALLRKFQVMDNPRKFALFQHSGPDGQVSKRKLSDEENPLHLRLLNGPDQTAMRFVMQENETGEVIWEAFTVPELQNFLRILKREEDAYVLKVQEKYGGYRQKLVEALATRKPG